MKNTDMKKEKVEFKNVRIAMMFGCVWCGKQIHEEEYPDHPRNCIYYQEYLRQIV